MDYDDIYGISIGDYLTRHDQTLSDILNKIQIDIDILKENQGRVMDLKLPYPENHIEHIVFMAIKKKQDHMERLLNWANEDSDRL